MSDNLSDAKKLYDQLLLEELAKITHTFNSNLTCACGGTWRSPTRFSGALRRLVSKNPCPGCGHHDNIHKASSDPERWEVRG